MTESDFLFTVAEVAAAFAGFSTLVVVVGERLRGGRGRLVRVRLVSMLQHSLIAILACLVPFVVERAEPSGEAVWRISACFYALAWLLYLASLVRGTIRQGDRLPPPSPVNYAHVLGLQPTVIVALALVAVGAWGRHASVVYLAAILVNLYLCGFLFLQQVSAIAGDEVTD